MPPEERNPGNAEDWLRHARSALELAKIEKPQGVLLENLCFHAQQAAEKALKAILVAKGIPFRKTHNIRILLDLLPHDVLPPPDVEDAAGLTDYAVISRHPGDLESVEEEEYMEALRLADIVIHWAETVIRSR